MYTPSEQAISFWHPGKDKQYQNLLLRHVFHQIQASNRLHTVQRFFSHGIIHKRGHQFKKFGCWGRFSKDRYYSQTNWSTKHFFCLLGAAQGQRLRNRLYYIKIAPNQKLHADLLQKLLKLISQIHEDLLIGATFTQKKLPTPVKWSCGKRWLFHVGIVCLSCAESSTITKRRLLAHNSVTAPLPPDKKQKEEKWRLRFNNLDLILLPVVPVQSSAILQPVQSSSWERDDLFASRFITSNRKLGQRRDNVWRTFFPDKQSRE